MKPDEPKNSQDGMSLNNQGSIGNSSDSKNDHASQEAAANLIRSQIDSLFEENNTGQIHSSAGSKQPDPYDRTHSEEHLTAKTTDWQQYHTAWQNYYQKYYEGYYKHTYTKSGQSLKTNTSHKRPRTIPHGSNDFFANNPVTEPEKNDKLSSDEALTDIKQKIVGSVQESAVKIRKSRHFIPILSGAAVVFLFLFLQYNRLLIANVAAYISPGNIDPQNIVIDPNTNLAVSPEPRLIIPKINVDVPVLYDVGNDHKSQLTAMTKGVAHFAIPGANSHPGQVGNTVISGHSSNDLLDSGDYKFIFAQLEKLEVGDTIYANYNSIRYTFTITKKEVVKPSEVSKLVYPTDKPVMTLITCTPLGTALNRLLITAEQISPDPAASAAAPAKIDIDTQSIPGNSPTFIERLFGAR